MRPRANKKHKTHTGGAATQQLVQLHGGAASHEANFRRILPSAMAKLLADGLFEPDGMGSYKITAKGEAKLKELDK